MKLSQLSTSSWTSRVLMTALGMSVVLSGMAGCAASSRNRGRNRSKVLEAENINMRQRMSTLNNQIRSSHAEQDAERARAQNLEGQISTETARAQAAEMQAQAAQAQAQNQATEAAAMRHELSGVQNEILTARRDVTALNQRYVGLVDRHKSALAALNTRPPAYAPPQTMARAPIQSGPSLQAEALRRDLENKLRGYGVRDLNVEVRNDFGQERVAIVLPDSFPAGKATLAHNKAAVKAVVGLATLIRSDYAASDIFVEGHTDSDPIRRSNWASNDALSEARAQAVRDLLSGAGVESGRISTRGFGAAKPLDGGSTKSSKSRNRRVEIFITPRA